MNGFRTRLPWRVAAALILAWSVAGWACATRAWQFTRPAACGDAWDVIERSRLTHPEGWTVPAVRVSP